MRFLIDAQLPTALARWIESQGQTARHVADLQMADASDRAIWQQARETGAVIISKDADFVTLATLDMEGPPVVWIRLGNTRRQALLNWFSPLFPEILEALREGEKLIEIE
jgi:predicted nuclease of predicted toxin-antitoxin system